MTTKSHHCKIKPIITYSRCQLKQCTKIAPRNSSFLHFHCLGTLPICNWINGSEASFTSRYEHQIPLFSSSSLVKNEGACAWYRKNTKLVYVYWVRYILPTYLKTNQNLLSICIKILYVNTIHFRISIGTISNIFSLLLFNVDKWPIGNCIIWTIPYKRKLCFSEWAHF